MTRRGQRELIGHANAEMANVDIVPLLEDLPRARNMTRAIYERIRSLVFRGCLRPGEQLPSEAELAQVLGVSRNTLREALNCLQQEGTISRQHGVGTFITTQAVLQNRLDINLGITELIKSMGRSPGARQTDVRTISAREPLTSRLQIAEGSELVNVERVRTADDEIVALSRDAFSAALLKGLSLCELRSLLCEEPSLYEMLENHLNTKIDYGVARVGPAIADREVAPRLKIAPGTVLMHIEQVDFDVSGHPLVYSQEYHLTGAYVFTVFRRR
jgi:GntR family transcriptional regulator